MTNVYYERWSNGNDDWTQPSMEDPLLYRLKQDSEELELYYRLAQIAPNHHQKKKLTETMEEKKQQLNDATNHYVTVTGRQPDFQFEPIVFHSFQDGLQKLKQTKVDYRSRSNRADSTRKTDYGSEPFVVNIEQATKQNNTFRTAIWTGEHLQVTLMSIDVGDDIGLELHPDVDQFLRVEHGLGLVQMGDSEHHLNFLERVSNDDVILVPAGKWHNLTNIGNVPLKLYSIYAPPEHPYGTVHETKAVAMAAEHRG